MKRPRLAAAAVFVVALAAAGAPTMATQRDHPIVFVRQVPVEDTFATIADIFGNFTSYDPREGQPVGGGLYRLDPNGTVSALVAGDRLAVRDPEVSFDGQTVLFAMKKRGRGRWQIYRIGLDGSGLRRVSASRRHNDWDPAELPDGRILFVTDRLRWADGYENLPEGQLFVMGPEGGSVKPLAVNPSGVFNPLPGSNGRIYFSQWDFHDCRRSIEERNCRLDVNRFLLWEIALDGSREGHPTFGGHTLFDFTGGHVQVREDPRRPGSFFGTLADEFFTFGAGTLVWMQPKRNGDRDRVRELTEPVFRVGPGNRAGRYRDPYPLASGELVASWAAGPVYDDADIPPPDFDLVVVDRRTGERRPLLEDPGAWLLQPVEARARPAPKLDPGEALPGFDYAVLNAKDVTRRHRNCGKVVNGDCQPKVRRGEAAAVRIFEVDRRRNYYRDFRRWDDPRQRLLGTAPVEPDGSFAAAVPARTPLIWELVDAAGEVLVRERFWTELAAGEIRTCNGCHSKHNGREIKRPNSALRRPTNLTGRTIDADGNGRVDLVEAAGKHD